MAKLGVKLIRGNVSPLIGQATFYEVHEFYPGTPIADHNKVKWNLYAIENGKPRLLDGGPTKFGRRVSYEFPQKWYGESLMIEAYVHSAEGKAPPGLIVRPVKGPKKVATLTIKDGNENTISTAPKYGEHITAIVTTDNMVGDEIDLAIWERDTISSTGHDAESNALLWNKKCTVSNKNGVVKQKILLDTGMMAKANKSFYEGSEHEYYLVVKSGNMQTRGTQTVAVSNSEIVLSPGARQNNPASARPAERGFVETITAPIVVATKIGWDMLMDRLNKAVTVEAEDEKKQDEDCPNCNKDITLAEIKAICVSRKNRSGVETSLISDETLITAALPHLNRYREKVGIKTCTSKAHFLAQLSVESKFYDVEEGFNYYWEALISTFGAFKTVEGRQKARDWGRAVRDRGPGYVAVSTANQTNIANWAYKSNNSNGAFASGDGSLYRGRGFKQITWKSNYKDMSDYFNRNMKIGGEADVDWEANPMYLTNNAKDAMVSALAFWGKHNLSNVGKKATDTDVERVTTIINPAKKGIDERKRFFKKAVEVLKINDCKHSSVKVGDEKGTILRVAGVGSKMMSDWVVYETQVFQNMSLSTYKSLKNDDKLPDADYSTFLARDAHGDKAKYGTHSNQRYGRANETPPGEYYLIPAVAGQSYKMYVSGNGSGASLTGPHGERSGVAIHQYSPKFAIGCLTTVTGTDTSIVNAILDAIPDLLLGDDKPVRMIIEERTVKEETWASASVGTTKWTGIL